MNAADIARWLLELRAPIFEGMVRDEVTKIVSEAHQRTYNAKEIIVAQGAPGGHFHKFDFVGEVVLALRAARQGGVFRSSEIRITNRSLN